MGKDAQWQPAGAPRRGEKVVTPTGVIKAIKAQNQQAKAERKAPRK